MFFVFNVCFCLYGVEVFQQISPVTLYLGEGQLEEVKDNFTALTSLCVTNGKNLTQQLQLDASTGHSQVNFLVYCSYYYLRYWTSSGRSTGRLASEFLALCKLLRPSGPVAGSQPFSAETVKWRIRGTQYWTAVQSVFRTHISPVA